MVNDCSEIDTSLLIY